jgi:hypothetical protein
MQTVSLMFFYQSAPDAVFLDVAVQNAMVSG